MKKAFSVALSVLLVAWMLLIPSNTLFADDEACFIVSSHKILAGDEVDVTITVKSSPGIASAKLSVDYGNNLTLDHITYNEALGGMCQEPNSLLSPVVLNWLSLEEVSGDLTYATLHFTTNENTPLGKNVINVTFEPDDVCDIDENNVDFITKSGCVTIGEINTHTPGDIDDSGEANNLDLVLLFQYLSGWDVENRVNKDAVDVNGDGDENNLDLIALFQYLSGWGTAIY